MKLLISSLRDFAAFLLVSVEIFLVALAAFVNFTPGQDEGCIRAIGLMPRSSALQGDQAHHRPLMGSEGQTHSCWIFEVQAKQPWRHFLVNQAGIQVVEAEDQQWVGE